MAKKKKVNAEEVKRISIRNISIIVGAILACLLFVFIGNSYLNRAKPIDTVRTLVENQFFDKGSYEDYQTLWVNPDKTISKKAYTDYRKNYAPRDFFQWDNQSVDSIMSHMKVVKVSGDEVKVYYLKDTSSEEELNKSNPWILDYVDDTWKIKN